MAEPTPIKNYSISVQTIDRVLNYLQRQPWIDANPLLVSLLKEIQQPEAIPMLPDQAIKPNDQ